MPESTLSSTLIEPGAPSCFLCETPSPDPLYRVCKCHQFVHETCYHRLLCVPAHATHCAVCASAYDLTISRGTRLRWVNLQASTRVMCVVAAMVGVVGLLALAFSLLLSDPSLSQDWLGHLSAGVLLLLMSFGGWLLLRAVWVHRRITEYWCCCTLREVITQTIVHMPTPIMKPLVEL